MMIFFKSVVCPSLPSFEDFNFFDLRLDQFLSPHLHRNNKYQDLWKVCTFIFRRLMGKVLQREASISINICGLRISMKYLLVRGWSMIISSRLMRSYMNIQFQRNCFIAASKCIPCMRKLAKKQRRLNPIKKT